MTGIMPVGTVSDAYNIITRLNGFANLTKESNTLNPKVLIQITDPKTNNAWKFYDPTNIVITRSLGSGGEEGSSLQAGKAVFGLTNENAVVPGGNILSFIKKYFWVDIWIGYNQPTVKQFHGYVDEIKPTSSASSGHKVTLECLDMFGILQLRKALDMHYSGSGIKDPIDVIKNLFQFNRVEPTLVDTSGLPSSGSTGLRVDVKAEGNTIAEVLEEIRRKTAFMMWIDGDGKLQFKPQSFFDARADSAWSLEYGKNIISIDVPDLAARANKITVFGINNLWAYAEDPVAQAVAGNGNPEQGVFEERFEDKGLRSYEACRKKAVEMLVEKQRNYKITIKTIFMPEIQPGDLVKVSYPFLPFDGIYVVRSYGHNITKENGATTDMDLYGSMISELPEEIIADRVRSVTQTQRSGIGVSGAKSTYGYPPVSGV